MTEIINVGNSVINNYIIPIGDDYLLIDTGYPNGYKAFVKHLKKANIPMEKIKYIVITHMHADHVGFLKQLLSVTKAKLIYDTDDKRRLEAGKNNMRTFISRFDLLISSKISVAFPDKTQCFPAVFYDNYVDAKTQPLLEYGIKFIPLKGHTTNDLCMVFEDKIFCGDICMTGFMSSKRAPIWIYNKYDLIASWEYLLKNTDAVYMYPTHGKPFLKSDLKKSVSYWRKRGVFRL